MSIPNLTTSRPHPPSPDQIKPAQPAHLLVVDDEPEIAEAVVDYLSKKENFRITLAIDGQRAIDYLSESLEIDKPDIDLVLLDMRMPNVSGLDVLNWIRSHTELRYTRVVLLTAAAGSSEKVEALTAGADDYVTKPYRPQELLARVNTILRTQQLEKLLQRQSQQLAILNQLSQAVAASLETKEVLETAVAGVNELLGIETACALIVEGGQLTYQEVFTNRQLIPVDNIPPLPKSGGLLNKLFLEQSSVFINSPDSSESFDPHVDVPVNHPIRSVIAAPLMVRDRPVGVLSAYNKLQGIFTEVDLDLFSSLASSISEAIENSWLFQRVRLRQQQILESRDTLQALIDGIPHPIYTINDHWQLVTVNESKAKELNSKPEDLVGPLCYKTFYNRISPCEHCHVALTLEKKEMQTWTLSYKGEDHLPREWDISAYPIPGKQKSSARAVILWQDRTEERRLESSLLQAGKLAAIGQLAAGVAHEINNPLTAVNANAEMLKMVIPKDDENYEAVELISLAGERASNVVRGLLDFARQEQYHFILGDLNTSIGQALDLVRYQLIQASINIVLNLDNNLPKVVASWEHLKGVWLNLFVNAKDAFEEAHQNREVEITTRLSEEKNHLQILVRDNGKGISQAEMTHIFEPFYTTKDPGKGTGLGLPTSHRIIEQHGGEINVVSVPNEGTTFIIRLPVDLQE
ncbi:MAG: response regulator [Chloroflexota bacterium]